MRGKIIIFIAKFLSLIQRTAVWSVPVFLPYLQPALTEVAVAEAEEWIGGRLPLAYVALLQIQNGGYIRFTGLNGLHTKLYGIGPYFPNLLDFDWTGYSAYVSFELYGLVPFDGDGHWHICLDYRGNNEWPVVTYIDIESDREERVADSFEAYLDQLVLETDDLYVLETDRVLADMAGELAVLLKIEWAEPDTRAHGYSVYWGHWEDQSIWLSANLAPRGFVRAWEQRYEELKQLVEGQAVRYPELEAGSLLLQVSDAAQGERLLALLAGYGVGMKPLKDFYQDA